MALTDNDTDERLLTRLELAHRLRVSLRTVDGLAADHTIPVIHVGRNVRFRLSEVARALTRISPPLPAAMEHQTTTKTKVSQP